jgi:hypothetical protein
VAIDDSSVTLYRNDGLGHFGRGKSLAGGPPRHLLLCGRCSGL